MSVFTNSIQIVAVMTLTAAAYASPIVIPQGTVIPVTLDTQLSSATNKVGDIFYAYHEGVNGAGFPEHSNFTGKIKTITRATSSKAGQIDARFTLVHLPDGSSIPIQGQLTSIDKNNVMTDTNSGRLIGTSNAKNNPGKFIAIGAGAGLLAGQIGWKKPLIGTLLGAAAGYYYSTTQNKVATGRDVVVKTGTPFGILLTRGVTIPDLTRSGSTSYKATNTATNNSTYNATNTAIDNANYNASDTAANNSSDNANYNASNDANYNASDNANYNASDKANYNASDNASDNSSYNATNNEIDNETNNRAGTRTTTTTTTTTGASIADGGWHVSFNSLKPMMVGNSLMVPFRSVMDSIDMPFDYNAAHRTLTMSRPNSNQSMYTTVGTSLVYVDGVATKFDRASRMVDGRVYVPASYIELITQKTAYWNNDTGILRLQ